MNRVPVMMAIFLMPLLAGCNQFLAQRMITPPNRLFWPAAAHRDDTPLPAETVVRNGRIELRVRVGPPEAVLAVWVRNPDPGMEIRGTILVLHGFLVSHRQVTTVAEPLRRAGYRVVLVDQRGHGKSTGDYITYGLLDAQDLAQLVTELQRRGLCGPTVGIYGTSYGAASAIHFAAADPRVRAVVAVACYTTLREEAAHYARLILPIPGILLTSEDFGEIFDSAGALAGFNVDDASPLAAIQRTDVPTLLIHGENDLITPASASRRLHAAAPDHTELLILPFRGHFALAIDPTGTFHRATRGWYDQHLGPSQMTQSRHAGGSDGPP